MLRTRVDFNVEQVERDRTERLSQKRTEPTKCSIENEKRKRSHPRVEQYSTKAAGPMVAREV
jgi:hypothetical protein